MPEPRTKLFYKIGEVSRLADVEPYILRYWETEFPSLCPRKNRGGQRVYQPRDLDMVLSIKRMLHEEGYTIAGARKKLAARPQAGKQEAAAQREVAQKEVSGALGAVMEKALKAPPGTQLDLMVMDDGRGHGQGAKQRAGTAARDSVIDDNKLASALGRFKDELIEILDLIK